MTLTISTLDRRSAGERSFADEYRRLYVLASSTARRRGSAVDEVEDVAQETLSRCYSHWPRLSGAAFVDAWVVRTASNVVVDHWRRRRTRDRALGAAPVAPAEVAPHDRIVLAEALMSLPRRQREVLALRYLDDLHEGDVARVLGCSVGTVRKAALRGREALRDRLGDVGLERFRAARAGSAPARAAVRPG